jgi:hypothetical protein
MYWRMKTLSVHLREIKGDRSPTGAPDPHPPYSGHLSLTVGLPAHGRLREFIKRAMLLAQEH